MASNWDVQQALKAIRETGEGLTPDTVREHPVLVEGYANAVEAHAALVDLCGQVVGRPGEALKCAFKLPPYTIIGMVKRRDEEGRKHMGFSATTVWNYENKGIDALTYRITGDDGPIAPEAGYAVDPRLRIDPDEFEIALPPALDHLRIEPDDMPIATPRTASEIPVSVAKRSADMESVTETIGRLIGLVERQDLRSSEIVDALNGWIVAQQRADKRLRVLEARNSQMLDALINSRALTSEKLAGLQSD